MKRSGQLLGTGSAAQKDPNNIQNIFHPTSAKHPPGLQFGGMTSDVMVVIARFIFLVFWCLHQKIFWLLMYSSRHFAWEISPIYAHGTQKEPLEHICSLSHIIIFGGKTPCTWGIHRVTSLDILVKGTHIGHKKNHYSKYYTLRFARLANFTSLDQIPPFLAKLKLKWRVTRPIRVDKLFTSNDPYNIQKRAHPISIQTQHPKKHGF